MSILLISDDDRSALACELLAQRLRQRGQRCLTIGLPTRAEPATAATRHSPLPPCQPQVTMLLEALVGSRLLEQASAVGLFLRNADQLKRFAQSHRNLARLQGHRATPIFSGPLQASLGDSLMEELYDRLCCDLLILPGERQHQAVNSTVRHWPQAAGAPQLLSMGFWYAPERPPQGGLNGGMAQPPHHLLALVQDSIPTAVGGKAQLLRQLIRWAEASPDWTLTVQRDHPWSDDDPWIPLYEPEEWTLPRNLVFAAPGQMLSHLTSCSVCLSISSPWAMTAMSWGRKTILIGDYGIHTNEGTTSWFGCGSMHRLKNIQTLDQLLDKPDVNQGWLESMGWGVHDGTDRLIKALEELKP